MNREELKIAAVLMIAFVLLSSMGWYIFDKENFTIAIIEAKDAVTDIFSRKSERVESDLLYCDDNVSFVDFILYNDETINNGTCGMITIESDSTNGN